MDLTLDELVGFCQQSGIQPKDDPKTIDLAVLILRQMLSPSLCQGTSRLFFDRELGGVKLRHAFYKTIHALIQFGTRFMQQIINVKIMSANLQFCKKKKKS